LTVSQHVNRKHQILDEYLYVSNYSGDSSSIHTCDYPSTCSYDVLHVVLLFHTQQWTKLLISPGDQ